MKRYYVLGDPVAHSLSPELHQTAFREIGWPATYEAMRIGSHTEALEVLRSPDVYGASVTIPLKVPLCPFMDELDQWAEITGAVNTVVKRDKRLHGLNTDVHGVIGALTVHGERIQRGTACVLGSGGAARAVGIALDQLGLSRIWFLARSPDRAEALVRELQPNIEAELQAAKLGSKKAEHTLGQSNVVCNATPLGMHPRTRETPVDAALLQPGCVVFDAVYVPRKTLFLEQSRSRGCLVVDGVKMFLQQAAQQFMLWTDVDPPIETMEKVLDMRLGAGFS